MGLTSEGVRPNDEAEGHDRTSLLLPDNQDALISSVAAAAAKQRIPVVVVVMGGGPLDMSKAKENAGVGAIMWVGCKFVVKPPESICCNVFAAIDCREL